MNHIYKSVWNTALGAWVAASELACGRGKSNSGTSKSKVLRTPGIGTLLLAVGMSLGTNSVLAVPYEWNFASPGTSSDWGTPANWLLGIVPTASDAAHINNGGAASVSTGGAANVLQVGISTTGNQLGVDAGGTLATTQGVIGANAGSGGSVQVQGTWTNNGTITVGESGTGALTVSGAGSVSSADGFVGQFAGSSGTVNLSGSDPTWTITDGLNVGIRGTGYVRIWNGTLSSGYAEFGSLGTGNGTVIVDANWINDGDLVIGGSGTGALVVNSGGVVSSNSAQLGSSVGSQGSARVNGGTVNIGTGVEVGSSGSGVLKIYNGGVVNVNSGNGIAQIATNLGSTGVLQIGDSVGPSTFAAPGALNAVAVAFGSGTGTLLFNHSGTSYVFAPDIEGGGVTSAINLQAGTTRFTGNLGVTGGLSGFSGTMNVTGGTLWVAATDTLQLTGDYVQTSGGTVRIDVANDTTFGKLVANNVTLPSNAKIDVNVANPNFSFTASSLNNVISADGMLTSDGTFSVTDNSVLFNFGAVKDVDGTVDLTLTAAGGGGLVEEIVVAQGNNPATGAARAIDAIKSSDPTGPVASLFVPFTTNEQVNTAVSQTLPLLTGGSQVAASAALTGINRVVQARIESNRGLSSGDAFYGDKKFWMKPFGSWADQDDRKGVSGYKANTSGLAFGADATVSDETRLGLSFAYANASVDGNSSVAPNSAKVDVYQLIGYGSHAFDPDTELNFQAGIGQNKNKGQRRLVAFGTTAVADYSSLTATAGAGLGRTYGIGEATRFTPSIRADYTWIKDKGYTETGAGALNLDVRGRTSDELILAVDGKVAHETDAGTTLTANLGVGYDVLNQQASITAAFAGAPGAAFTTQGLEPSPWVLRGGVGMVKTMQSGMELTARYDAEYRRDFLNQSVSVKLRWAF